MTLIVEASGSEESVTETGATPGRFERGASLLSAPMLDVNVPSVKPGMASKRRARFVLPMSATAHPDETFQVNSPFAFVGSDIPVYVSPLRDVDDEPGRMANSGGSVTCTLRPAASRHCTESDAL